MANVISTKNSMRSLVRAISVMQSFTPNELELGGVDIARKVGIPKTTAYRILETLAEGGLLERNEKTGKYAIGPVFYALGRLYLSTTDVLKTAEPVIETLNELTNESVHMGIFVKGDVILVIQEESRHAVRYAPPAGTLIPAYASAIGKVFLSELTEAELDRLYPEERLRPLTKKTVASKTELRERLEQIRKTGVSIEQEGTYEGIEGIASVIHDASGRAVAAMVFPIPTYRMNQSYRERLATLIKLGCSLTSYRLGYQDKVNPIHDIEDIRLWWEQNK